MEERKGWLGMLVKSIGARFVRCKHTDVVYLGIVTRYGQEFSVGYCKDCFDIITLKEENCTAKLGSYVSYSGKDNKFLWLLHGLEGCVTHKSVAIDTNEAIRLIEHGDVILTVAHLKHLDSAARIVLNLKDKEIKLLGRRVNDLMVENDSLTKLIKFPIKEEQLTNEELFLNLECIESQMLSSAYRHLMEHNSLEIGLKYKTIFKHMLSLLYGYEKARKRWEWKVEGELFMIYKRTKKRK